VIRRWFPARSKIQPGRRVLLCFERLGLDTPACAANILLWPLGARMKGPIKPFRVSVVQCRGTPYEVGRAQARLFAMTPKGRAFLRSKTMRFPWWFKLQAEHRMFAKFAPVLWEELAGLADELGIPMEQAAVRFGNDGMRPPIGGCSAAVTAGVYGRNYDFRPRYYGAQFVLLQASGSYASIGSSHQLTGRLDGMNEHGLMIGLHQVKMSPRFPGLSADLIVRIVLDQCSTTVEAVEKLRQLPHAMQYNYSLLDAGGMASVVEAGPGAVAARTGAWLACTNHFQSALLRPLNDRRRAAHSQQRLPPLEAWASAGIFPWIFARGRYASHHRRRAGQAAAADRDRRRRRSSRRGHAGYKFRSMDRRRGFAGIAS
jgi:hypothetical protein